MINQYHMNIGAGENIKLRTLDKQHFGENPASVKNDDVAGSFRDMLVEAVGKTNDLQVEADNLRTKMIYEPESVDIHQVMIAGQKAEISLSFTKAVRDEAIKAYRELMNLR